MISEIKREYIWLDSFKLPLKKKQKLIEFCGGIKKVSDCIHTFKSGLENIISLETISYMQGALRKEYIEEKIDRILSLGIEVTTIEDDNYPRLLREISDPPLVLYTIGDASILNKKCLAVVGTRQATSYGREVALSFSKTLSKTELVLVSGLAYGIDTCVAQAVLETGKPTVAVMGGGLDKIYPAQNSDVARRIVETGGVLVSEYPPDVGPNKSSFLERNRIISGLSLGVLVVEAGLHSGAESTANDCVLEGRSLFVIPGNITSAASAGCNRLLVSWPQAICTDPSEILKELNISEPAKLATGKRQFSIEESLVIDALSEERSIDEIAEISKLDTQTLLTVLSRLEIGGIIKRTNGNYYAKITLQF